MSKDTMDERLVETLSKEAKKFTQTESKLRQSFEKFSKMGIETKSTYSLPLKDTIGRTFREQIQFKCP